MVDGTMAITAAWSGLVVSANRELSNRDSTKEGNPRGTLAVVVKEALVSTDWWVIPATAAHPEAAQRLLAAMYSPNSSAKAITFSKNQGYATVFDGSSEKDLDPIVTIGSHFNQDSIAIDETFWSKNLDWINQKWRLWRAGNDWR